MGTTFVSAIFAITLSVAAASPHAAARRLMAEAEQTTNPVRLLLLALDIRKSLDAALQARPDDVEVRLDLVRFHAVTPALAGGDRAEARRQAGEIAKRDAALGHFAAGYLAYRLDKQFGLARIEFREAISGTANPTHRALAMRWLGWLSQETQQWPTAFDIFEALGDDYEIGRTAAFCRCELERGRKALQAYLKTKPAKEKEARELLRDLR